MFGFLFKVTYSSNPTRQFYFLSMFVVCFFFFLREKKKKLSSQAGKTSLSLLRTAP